MFDLVTCAHHAAAASALVGGGMTTWPTYTLASVYHSLLRSSRGAAWASNDTVLVNCSPLLFAVPG